MIERVVVKQIFCHFIFLVADSSSHRQNYRRGAIQAHCADSAVATGQCLSTFSVLQFSSSHSLSPLPISPRLPNSHFSLLFLCLIRFPPAVANSPSFLKHFRNQHDTRSMSLVIASLSKTAHSRTLSHSTKLAQLKHVILDKPREPLKVTKDGSRGHSEDEEEPAGSSSGRVVPKNPRESETIANGSLEDISQLFMSDDYEPGYNGRKKSEGPCKLFTKEEKVLLNRRSPYLIVANSSKWFPLHTLTASGEFYLMDKLLKHNVDINAVDKDGLTALHRAIICKKQAIANYLLRESANPYVRDKEGATLMHYAVRAANIQTIKILILYNVDVNLPDEEGWTPLHLAVQTRRTDVLRLLLIKGADKTVKNYVGLTPLDLCLYSGRDMRTYELIKILKELPKSK